MRIILLGSPGAGKGTQADWMSKHYTIPCISTGAMLRDAIAQASSLGLKAESIIKKGQLMPDDIIIDLIRYRIAQADCQKGFLLDGFPRTLAQAAMLRVENIPIDVVLEFIIPETILIERFSGRRIHPASGRTYHVRHNPPHVPGRDDLTGAPLIQREDDQEAVAKKRLAIYYEQTQPLLKYYEAWSLSEDPLAPKCIRLAADAPIPALRAHIFQLIKSL